MEEIEAKSEGIEPETDSVPVPSYGLLVINNAYNEGRITFQEWLDLSREWALMMVEQDKARVKTLPLSTYEQ